MNENDLVLKWHDGEMIIHLEEFLGCRSIQKFRKLVKIIHDVDWKMDGTRETEALDQIRTFIKEKNVEFPDERADCGKYITGYEQKIKFCQQRLDTAVTDRDKFKRSTPVKKSEGWEKYNDMVKQYREELAELKMNMRAVQKRLDILMKNRKFYMQCLDEIS